MATSQKPVDPPDLIQPRGANSPSWLQWVYLALAIAGAVLPWLANIDFIRTYGSAGDPGLFLQLASANPAAASLSRDLAIGATAVLIWIVHESRRLQMRGLPWVLLSCVTLAFACGAPLFLYLRERRLAELGRQAAGTQDPGQGD
ncbi:MAG: DUF2834 domain-containing protein [Prochlorococcaceae cyanobacterium]